MIQTLVRTHVLFLLLLPILVVGILSKETLINEGLINDSIMSQSNENESRNRFVMYYFRCFSTLLLRVSFFYAVPFLIESFV